jgi:phospholipase/lecithinase/hemolysin
MRAKILAFLALLVALAAAPARAAGPTQLIVFGDSLSDTGNNGRFTSSYLWDEHVAGAYRIPFAPSSQGGTDYAISGALITSGSNSLPNQVQTYLTAHPVADPLAVYVIWGGGNDVFSTLANPGMGAQIEAEGIADTLAMLNSLYTAGARFLVVGNVPRTDLTPYVRSLGQSAVKQQRQLVLDWNVKLDGALNKLHLKGAKLRRYDSAGGLDAVFVSPTHFGFSDYTDPCNNTCTDPAYTFFWDSIHPAQTGHMLIGSAYLALIAQ